MKLTIDKMKHTTDSPAIDTAKKAAALALIATLGWALAGRPASADRSNGPGEDTKTLGARQVRVYHEDFDGAEEAAALAVGTGDIDIKVYDENGNLVAADTKSDNVPIVNWTPAWTGPFTIKVINATHHRVAYSLRIR